MTSFFLRGTVSVLALGWSTLAFAGDTPLYEAAPDWIERVELEELERDPANDLVVRDNQIRIEEGLLWQYRDEVLRISNAELLTASGTVTARWFPDKGDLIIHDIVILRDGQRIDILEQGERFEVLRRESRLESQVLDGSLTGTLSIPGLQIGDDLRVTYSITSSDQALGPEVQSQTYLWRKPTADADLARVIVSWPEDLDVQYLAGPDFELGQPEARSGYEWLEVALPLPEAEELPEDAPLRFRRATYLQVGTFADWAEVSSTMAPHYTVAGAMDGLDDLVARTEQIRSDYGSDLERAVAALDLVQDEIRYLLNGLDGGNYIPQDVATTWERKYGDCKAKTMMLLALLDRLGIAAEPALVATETGNSLPALLPLPGAFDHVIVKATIDGVVYYLDGTSTGASLALVGNVPGFEYALPIRASGAELEPIVQTLPRVADMTIDIKADASAGGDLPALVTMSFNFRGAMGAQFYANRDKLTEDRKRELARSMDSSVQIIDVEIVPGENDSEAALVMTGIASPIFDFEGLRGELDASFSVDDINFAPDRSRRDWRQLPVTVGAPNAAQVNLHAILPIDADRFEVRGALSLDGEVAGRRYQREATLAANELSVIERIITLGGEIAPDQIAAERRKASIFARNEAKLIAPETMPRRWRFAQSDDRSALAPLEAAYAAVIANDPEDAKPYLSRAGLRYDTYDFEGALEDMNMVIEIEGTAEYYSQRATVHMQLLDFEAARDDLEEAYLLEPSPWRAMSYADVLYELGEVTAAREILEAEGGDEDVRESLAVYLAKFDAYEGKKAQGLARLDALLHDDPNDASNLNRKCWYMANWSVDVDQGVDVCTRAVETGGNASAIDSRAMMFLRAGQLDKALQDLNAALTMAPDQVGSLLLRGIVRLEIGDRDGQADIDAALAREPMIGVSYRKWGFDI